MKCKLYVLIDPDTKEIRYLGQTTGTLIDRLSKHIYSAKIGQKSHLCNWIRRLLKQSKRPEISLFISDAIWNEDEILWIQQLKNDGYRLVNTTEGGNGVVGLQHSEETRRKMSSLAKSRDNSQLHAPSTVAKRSGNKHYCFGKKMLDGTKEALYKANKGKKWTKERRKKRSDQMKGRKFSEESKRKISESNKGKHGIQVKCIETGIIYQSATEAAIVYNTKKQCILGVCHKRKRCITAKGLHWEFINATT